MGTHKKEKNRRERQNTTGDGMGNVKVKGENFYRSAKKVKVLKRLTDGTPQRNAQGKITKAASYQTRDAPVARVEVSHHSTLSPREGRLVVAQQRLLAREPLLHFSHPDLPSY